MIFVCFYTFFSPPHPARNPTNNLSWFCDLPPNLPLTSCFAAAWMQLQSAKAAFRHLSRERTESRSSVNAVNLQLVAIVSSTFEDMTDSFFRIRERNFVPRLTPLRKDAPKCPQHAPKIPKINSKYFQDSPRLLQDKPKISQRWAKIAPRQPKIALR